MSNVFKALLKSDPQLVALGLDGAGTRSTDATADSPRRPGTDGNGVLAEPHRPKAVETNAEPATPSQGAFCVRPMQLSYSCPFFSSGRPQAYAAEQYRILRTKTTQLLKRPFRAVITSSGSGDGKTLTAINLAAALSLKSEERTLLIDADLRRASVHRFLGIAQGPGLADILSGFGRLEDAVIAAEELPRLHVLPAGCADINPTELFGSSRWRVLADESRRRFAHVIVDSPPLDVVADYDLIAEVCDGVIFVVRPEHSNRTLTLAGIEKLRPKLTGIVMNAVPDWPLWRNSRHRYSYYRPIPTKRRGNEQ